jgi:hypothetical protein
MTVLTITATATDAHGQEATAQVTVDVLDPQPTAAAEFGWFGPPPLSG